MTPSVVALLVVAIILAARHAPLWTVVVVGLFAFVLAVAVDWHTTGRRP